MANKIFYPQSRQNSGELLESSGKTTVFYDGSCSLCSREIAHYKKISRSGQIHWQDISINPKALSKFGISELEAMRRFHIVSSDGEVITGARAFVHLWSLLPYWKVVSFIVKTLGVSNLLELIYSHFARWRFSRTCVDASCSTTKGSGGVRQS